MYLAPDVTGSELTRVTGQMSQCVVVFSSLRHRLCCCSAVLGHHRHRRGRCFTHRDVLLLHCEEMLLQEEEEQEGQEGEGRHRNEEPEGRRGKFHQWRPRHWRGNLQPALYKKRKTRPNAHVYEAIK